MPPTRTPKRAYVETYGCQMNISDGELMEGILSARGYEIVHRPEDADVVLVNTCAGSTLRVVCSAGWGSSVG